jgi:hypothetical protein
MMKWWEDYEFASELYDDVQKHQQSFKNHMIYPKSGLYGIRGRSIEFIFPKTMNNGFVFQTWRHKIYLGMYNDGDSHHI